MGPTASEITVREVLAKLETDFAAVAEALENGEFALWVGSGISRQAPSLGTLLERAFEYLRQKAVDPLTKADYAPALEELLGLAEINPATVSGQYGLPLANWPERVQIIDRLWNRYSQVLDIRIRGRDADYVLWNAIDIRAAFADARPPGAEHLCIAILVLEGAVQAIASANWDGFLEAAIARLSNNVPGIVQVVVDPNQLRGPAGRARLLKFHGCIVHATREPLVFRRFLTGSHTQIIDWPERAEFAAMCNAVVGLATSHKTLVLGLSIQDNNLQTLFARAKRLHAWPWPCAPAAPAHVFCEDTIQRGQRDVLRLAYGEAYDADPPAVHAATLLRAWAEKALIALVLKVLAEKLSQLLTSSLEAMGKGQMAGLLGPFLVAWRDDIADRAVPPPGVLARTDLVNAAIAIWSRMLGLFRNGALPANAEAYETLSTSTPRLLAADPNAQAMGLGRLGIALSLLQYGRETEGWELRRPVSAEVAAGALTVRASRADGVDRPVFLVKSATEAIRLKSQGAFADDKVIVMHMDEAWHQMEASGTSARRVRGGPGRTGRVGETHVSLGMLLDHCNDAATLQREFVAEMIV